VPSASRLFTVLSALPPGNVVSAGVTPRLSSFSTWQECALELEPQPTARSSKGVSAAGATQRLDGMDRSYFGSSQFPRSAAALMPGRAEVLRSHWRKPERYPFAEPSDVDAGADAGEFVLA
jgi:hypothetical protein